MLKKFLSSAWGRTVLPLALLPLAAYLQPVWENWDSWPELTRWASLEDTNLLIMSKFSQKNLPYFFAACATGIILGILWHSSSGARRFGYYVLLVLFFAMLYPEAQSYGIMVDPPFRMWPAASPLELALFWLPRLLFVAGLVAWDMLLRKNA